MKNNTICTYDISWDSKNKRLLITVLKTILKQVSKHSIISENIEFIYDDLPCFSNQNYGDNNCLKQVSSDNLYVVFTPVVNELDSGEIVAENIWKTLLVFASFSGSCTVPLQIEKHNQLFYLINEGSFSFFLRKEMFDLFSALGDGRIDLSEEAMAVTYQSLHGFEPLPNQFRFFSKGSGYCEASIEGSDCSIGLLDPENIHHMNCGWIIKGIGVNSYKQRLIMIAGLAAAFTMARKHSGQTIDI